MLHPATFLCFSIIIFLSQALLYHEYIMDDAFISFRYSRNLIDGHGLVWNPGESPPVEGYSNFLWVTVMAVLMKAGAEPVVTSKILGVLFGLAGLILMYMLCRRLWGKTLFAALPPMLTALFPEHGLWGIGGLETQMYLFLLIVSVYLFLSEQRSEGFPWSGIAFALLALTRSEGPIYFAATYLFLFLFPRGGVEEKYRIHAGHFKWTLLFVCFYLPYFLWRIFYYKHFFPNTYYAKQSFLGGLDYIMDFFLVVSPFLAIGIFGFLGTSRRQAVYLYFLVFAATIPLLNIDPQMGDFNRFLIHILPLLSLLAVIGIKELKEKWNIRVAYLLLSGLLLYMSVYCIHHGRSLKIMADLYSSGMNRVHIMLGKKFREEIPPDRPIALADCGAIPYYSNLPTIDTWGLVNASKTHDPDYSARDVMDNDPEVLIFQSYSGENLLTPWAIEKQIFDFPGFRENYSLSGRYSFTRKYWLWVFRKM
jgi:hypothetical protein